MSRLGNIVQCTVYIIGSGSVTFSFSNGSLYCNLKYVFLFFVIKQFIPLIVQVMESNVNIVHESPCEAW